MPAIDAYLSGGVIDELIPSVVWVAAVLDNALSHAAHEALGSEALERTSS